MTLDKLRAWILKGGHLGSITTVWKTLRRLELGSSNDLSFYVRQAARRVRPAAAGGPQKPDATAGGRGESYGPVGDI